MKKTIVILTALITLVSCGNGSSGKRFPVSLVRVRVLDDNSINWVRFTEVEMKVYNAGDTILINPMFHSMATIGDKEMVMAKIETIIPSASSSK